MTLWLWRIDFSTEFLFHSFCGVSRKYFHPFAIEIVRTLNVINISSLRSRNFRIHFVSAVRDLMFFSSSLFPFNYLHFLFSAHEMNSNTIREKNGEIHKEKQSRKKVGKLFIKLECFIWFFARKMGTARQAHGKNCSAYIIRWERVTVYTLSKTRIKYNDQNASLWMRLWGFIRPFPPSPRPECERRRRRREINFKWLWQHKTKRLTK